jgi:dienelactone hydrolase
MWEDRDHRASKEVLDAYRKLAARTKNVELHIFPGIQHGWMMPGCTMVRRHGCSRCDAPFAILKALQEPQADRTRVA